MNVYVVVKYNQALSLVLSSFIFVTCTYCLGEKLRLFDGLRCYLYSACTLVLLR